MVCSILLLPLLLTPTECIPNTKSPPNTLISVERIEAWHNDPYFIPLVPETQKEEDSDERSTGTQSSTVPDNVLSGIARRVAYCESGLRNVHNAVSSASGYYQFIDSTWLAVTGTRPPAADHSLSEQTAAFYELWDGGIGASHWQESNYCWQFDQPWEHYDR